MKFALTYEWIPACAGMTLLRPELIVNFSVGVTGDIITYGRGMKFYGVIWILITGLLVAISPMASAGAQAAPEAITLNQSDTYVGFEVSYLLLFKVTGRFDDFAGEFVVDRENPENNRADIIINTASVDTGSATRDRDVRGPLLFNAEQYPTMIFHSTKIERGADNTGYLIGDLTLRGVTRPISLFFVTAPGGSAREKRGDKIFADGFKIIGKINRSDFGMNEFIRPIGDTVSLLVCYNMGSCDPANAPAALEQPHYNQ